MLCVSACHVDKMWTVLGTVSVSRYVRTICLKVTMLVTVPHPQIESSSLCIPSPILYRPAVLGIEPSGSNLAGSNSRRACAVRGVMVRGGCWVGRLSRVLRV